MDASFPYTTHSNLEPFPQSQNSLTFISDYPFHDGINSNLSLKQIHNNIPHLNQISPFSIDISSKTVYDPIHGSMTFPKYMWEFIDTPQFQRLRFLKQLSITYFVYPGGNHTRFEHCLGTGYLANDLVKRCFRSLNCENKYIIDCVSLAGLCHDIGHGPFSHTFDSILHSLGIGKEWNHEDFSKDILKYLIDDNYLDVDNDKLNFIHSLIIGDKQIQTDYQWIYQIVANKTNSIDVDKFDYICRDIYHLGLHNLSVDYSRVYNDCKIIDDTICYSEKNDYTLLSIFESRLSLHKKVYKHNKGTCINTMIKDALCLSNSYFNFNEAIKSPQLFLQLDDNIIQIIRNFSLDPDEEIRNDPSLLKAEQIINDLYSRNLYRFIGDILIPTNIQYEPDVNEFLCYDNPKDELYVNKEDVELVKLAYDFGNKFNNPFNNIYFYNPKQPNKCFKKLQRHSLLTPNVFREYCVKVICKDKNKVERVTNMFNRYKMKLYKQWGVPLNENQNKTSCSGNESHEDNNNNKSTNSRVFDFLGNKRKMNILTPHK